MPEITEAQLRRMLISPMFSVEELAITLLLELLNGEMTLEEVYEEIIAYNKE